MKEKNVFERTNEKISNSISLRLLLIGFIMLILSWPIGSIMNLIEERSKRQEQATEEIHKKWGRSQHISAFILSIPYTEEEIITNDKNLKEKVIIDRVMYLLADDLLISGDTKTDKRARGIFEVPVYSSQLNIKGSFIGDEILKSGIPLEDIKWDDAKIHLGMSDFRGIKENLILKWGKDEVPFETADEHMPTSLTGMSCPVDISVFKEKGQRISFETELIFNGSSYLYFSPFGKNTKVEIKSDWLHPKFDGAHFPDQKEIGEDGFTASWKLIHLNRTYPQLITSKIKDLHTSDFGVNFLTPLDEYQKSMRSAKYAMLIIALTFLVYFFIQVKNKVQIHPIQYGLVGFALCVFYILLVALSEHISFNFSYLIASTATVILISSYSRSIVKRFKLIRVLFGSILAVYWFVFGIIQSEDYALLMGSIGLFVVLGVVMFISKDVNWYNNIATEDQETELLEEDSNGNE
ncbi:cell envelope integrity protein CreD [Sediminitomix flava]|uniref:Inner membrane protein n=1 Tax=Sediminitomix flava TaxID=379075 RepID=A0A315Z781_SEDFL|nr:cell envelope integrity protein CreD [Sediminitomix flava]PWJ40193.1 inner membrane protein [Sediminitomix flava]